MTYFIANWKMNAPALPAWAKEVAEARLGRDADIIVCPPFTQLAAAQMVLSGTEIALGAQDCHTQTEGAFTGDIAAPMLVRAGCRYVIVGHSERREHHHEDDAQVVAKAKAAVDADLVPIVCVGEPRDQRDGQTHLEWVSRQLDAFGDWAGGEMLIAYEPIWAIGTGLSAQLEDIVQMHEHIKKRLGKAQPVLYGGSVKPQTASSILALAPVDGVLVGGASLRGEDFAAMIKEA